ncbi:TPA: hypothetical protein H1005_03715, partial [archaeon]|nr:hypothetical protein [Candidatus Naiadarchaeales archaeon SRR2090153.bin1042]
RVYRTSGETYGGRSHATTKSARIEVKPELEELSKISTGLIGTGQAALLAQSGTTFKEVGRVPKSDISSVLKNLQEGKAQALIVDGEIDQSLVNVTTAKGITYVIGSKKPRFLKRKPGIYVLDSTFLRKIVSEQGRSK